MTYEVITIGSATRDVFCVSKAFRVIRSNRFATGVAECVALGSKIELDELVLTTGGGGTNAAATFASLGLKTAVVTRIGDDAPGEDVLRDLERVGVDISLVKIDKRESTGYSTLLTTVSGERSVLVHRGAARGFKPSDVPLTKLKTDWLYLTSLGGNVALALKIARHARKQGIKLAYNPGSLELSQGLKSLQPIMKLLTLLSLNLEEAQLLAGSKSKDVSKLCEKLSLPGLTLIITDGARGAYAYLDGTTWYARPHPVKVISRTGAGDAFGSGVVAALARGQGLDDALKIGVLNSESVIQSYGAKHGILSKWPSAATLKNTKVKVIN